MIMSKASLKQRIIGKAVELFQKKSISSPEIAPISKDLSNAKVALITTAGVHLAKQKPFDTENGDYTFRVIPDETPLKELTISHGHYDKTFALKDINCVFPIARLHELKVEGVIGSLATYHIGIMGYIPQVEQLNTISAPAIVKLLKEDQVDIAIISPG